METVGIPTLVHFGLVVKFYELPPLLAVCEFSLSLSAFTLLEYRALAWNHTAPMAHERSCGSAYTSPLTRIAVAESLGKACLSS